MVLVESMRLAWPSPIVKNPDTGRCGSGVNRWMERKKPDQ